MSAMYLTYEGALLVLAVFVAFPLCHGVALLVGGVRRLSRWLRARRETPAPTADPLAGLRVWHGGTNLSHR
jgi:hypothetical protein